MKSVAFAVLVAGATTLAWYLIGGGVHLNVVDEGYLWYGVERTAEGELPIRDFQAYDPGRYWWCAALAPVLGTGILGVRGAAAVFQAIGLLFGLLAARRAVERDVWLIPIALVLSAWMFPRHKVFEPSLAMTAVYLGVRLLENPSARQHLLTGLFVGAAALFGKNHGAYAAVGTLFLSLFATLRCGAGEPARRLFAWAGGIVVGFSPVLLLFLLAPGFAASYVDWTLAYLKLGGNIPHAWPWPWRIELGGLAWHEVLARVGEALAFFLPVVVLPAGLLVAWRTKPDELGRRALPIAATVLGAVYLHHAVVRSDPQHYAQCVHPILLGLFALPAAFGWSARRAVLVPAWSAAAALVAFFLLESHPLLRPYAFGRPEARFTEHAVAGEMLLLPPARAAYFRKLERAVAEHVGDDALFVAPSRPGLYPLLGKRSPSWWIYFFVPDAEDAAQRELIGELEDTDWALVVDVPVGQREELRFERSHPLVWSHLTDEFRPVPTPELPDDHLLLRRGAGSRGGR
jgi:hypothetical protein